MIRARVTVNPRIKNLDEFLKLDVAAVRDAAESVDVAFRAHEKRLFQTEGTEGGQKWASLKPEYKQRKDRLFSGARAYNRKIAKARGGKVRPGSLGASNKILQLTGDMRRAFSERGGDHVAEASLVNRKWILRFGAVGPDYAIHHERGGGSLPRRSPLQHTLAQVESYMGHIRRRLIPHLMRRVKAIAAWRGLR